MSSHFRHKYVLLYSCYSYEAPKKKNKYLKWYPLSMCLGTEVSAPATRERYLNITQQLGKTSSPPFLAKWDLQKMSLMNAVVSVSLLRRGVTHNFCGQTEAEQEVRKKRSQHEQLCSDSGDPAPARSLLLHWQGQHTAQTPPHPDCLHCHKGRGSPLGPTCRCLSSFTGCFSGEMCFD